MVVNCVFPGWLVGAVGKNRWDGGLVLLEEIFGPRGTLNVCMDGTTS